MTADSSPKGRTTGRTTGRLRPRLLERIDALERRVAELETANSRLQAELREEQRLQRRLAELTDVVQELLVPIAQRDEDGITELLAKYRDSL